MIPSFLSGMTFINPWILAGLAFLPALWFLLRVTPPAPRLIRFPAARFLAGLKPEDHTTRRTPWWILLLRLLIAALIIVALARPVLNPADTLDGDGPVRLVMDNGWSAAQTWRLQTIAAQDLINRAGREKRSLYILTTAPEPAKQEPAQYGPLTAAQAQTILKGLTPHPWRADYAAAARIAQSDSGTYSYWLSSGIRDSDEKALVEKLKAQGRLKIFIPPAEQLPLLLKLSQGTGSGLSALVDFLPETQRGVPVTVEVTGQNGRILDVQSLSVTKDEKPVRVHFDLPETLRNQMTGLRLSGRSGAGATFLIDDSFKRRVVGVISTAASGGDNTPLVDADFYLQRALEPFADVRLGSIPKLLAEKPSVIILPDIGALPPADLNDLEEWVHKGGLLMRFAGLNMTQSDNFLTPVPLMKGGRALDGSLTWEKPQVLQPFADTSPYYGLAIPPDLVINRQLLAEPVEGLEKMTWATLQDGTPLITAKPINRGMLVLVHTTATPLWSNLALSGLFVQILQRTVSLSGTTPASGQMAGNFQPLLVMDGFGTLRQPDGSITPIAADVFETTAPSSTNPPGFYGRAGYQQALNLGDHIESLSSFSGPALASVVSAYGQKHEKELMPAFLIAAFVLFMADWIIMMILQSGLRMRFLSRAAVFILIVVSNTGMPAYALSPEENIKYAADLYLAYIKTGNPSIDSAAQKGLETLALVLTQRTSVEPAGVVALDPAQDDLAFFPFIYWPVATDNSPLPADAQRRIQFYLDHGGTIMFDTRDQQSTPREGGVLAGGRNAASLRVLTQGLNIPPLVGIPPDHVLTKSFYLMKDFPSRYNAGALWIEENSASGRDGVSSVIISNHDWGNAWSPGAAPSPGQTQELSLRFGVNLVMYALTGNYKADQVHLPYIIERLGQ